mgnify:FL=1
MTKQVVIIHGGTTFNSKKEYLEYLENQTIDIERLKPGYDWKQTVQEQLGDQFSVLCVKMPNSTNSQYNEWKLWFENLLTVLNKELILVGHSLGAVFLAKYLSEHLIDNSITKLILVAPPYSDTKEEPLASFKIKGNLHKIDQQVPKIYIFHSKDDVVVPYQDALIYEKNLNNSELISFDNRQHFNQENFPELVAVINKP